MPANKTIPFRPKLEGVFLTRFYATAEKITNANSQLSVESLISDELRRIENECSNNIDQRCKCRAVWLLLRDLIRINWKACFRAGVLELSLPEKTESGDKASSGQEKERLRNRLKESRLERLRTFGKFIRYMENGNKHKRSVLTLVSDGKELADRLLAANLHEAVRPKLEAVNDNARDDVTGHRLGDIWRYFRLTWSTPAESTPGRTMRYLIRDYAHPARPVMGIISLENCVVQITDRDKFIGWNAKEFIDKMRSATSADARLIIKKLLSYVESGIAGIDYSEICKPEDVNYPTSETVFDLIQKATLAEKLQIKDDSDKTCKSAEEVLYRRKRAKQLAHLLASKKNLSEIINDADFDNKRFRFLDSEKGYSAIRNALVAQKSKHIGSSMLELNVCGAIPPYNEILGGKLAALLALSPQILRDYKKRYGQRESEIATRLKNEAVVRPAELVYIGTTSLYYVGSSQYNRLKLPSDISESGYDVKWAELGKTVGFGTLHISRSATAALTEAADIRPRHFLGEGANPKLRLIKSSIRKLLEISVNDADEITKHAMSRIVYGACIARNAREYLLGCEAVPEYWFGELTKRTAVDKTNAIIRYWVDRWLNSRVKYEPVFERLRTFDVSTLRLSEQLKVQPSY